LQIANAILQELDFKYGETDIIASVEEREPEKRLSYPKKATGAQITQS